MGPMKAKLLAVAGWSLLGVVLFAGAGDKGELRLKRLVIEDDQGRERILLQMAGGDLPTIIIKDEQGGDGVTATATAGASLLTMSAGKSGNAIVMMVGPEISPRVDLQKKGRKVNSLAIPR